MKKIVFDCDKSIGFTSSPFYYVETIDALDCESFPDIQEEFGALKIDEDLFMYGVPLCKAYEGMSSGRRVESSSFKRRGYRKRKSYKKRFANREKLDILEISKDVSTYEVPRSSCFPPCNPPGYKTYDEIASENCCKVNIGNHHRQTRRKEMNS